MRTTRITLDRIYRWIIVFSASLMFLSPWDRFKRSNQLFFLLIFICLASVRSWWLRLFGLVLTVSFWVRGGNSRHYLIAMVFIVAVDRLTDIFHPQDILRYFVGMASIAAALSYYTLFRHGHFVGPLDNTIIAGPIFAIASVLAMRVHWSVALWLGLAALVTRSTTAALCLVAGYAPYINSKVPLSRGVTLALQAGAVVVFSLFIDGAHQFRDRIDMLGATLERGREMFFGWGIGTFKVLIGNTGEFDLFGQKWGTAHNDLVQLFFEMGYVPFLLASAFILWHCWRMSRAGNVPYRPGRLEAMGAMSAFIVFVLVGFPFHYGPAAGTFAVVWSYYRWTT